LAEMSHSPCVRAPSGLGLAAAFTTLWALGCGRTHEPTPPPTASWLRPAPGATSEPIWGIEGGLSVGLWPTSGPRGLLRIYTPFLGQPPGRMLNFISVEPVIRGDRAQSELDKGRDGKPGLLMWAADSREGLGTTGDPKTPTSGRIEQIDGIEMLTFFIATEPFRTGARPVIQVLLRADRPREVGLRVYSAPGGTRMDSCVLSATMGNYARLRRLWLSGEVVDSRKLWPTFTPDPLGFAPWRAWNRDGLLRSDGQLVVAATSDEPDPAAADYDAKVPKHWRYEGRPCTQYWRTAAVPEAVVRVNGRTTYWGGGGPIPGGIAYENFEMEAPFADGQEFWFGVTPDGPDSLGFDRGAERNPSDGR
jgi:hypothetical protein